jgi:hypothetical protein
MQTLMSKMKSATLIGVVAGVVALAYIIRCHQQRTGLFRRVLKLSDAHAPVAIAAAFYINMDRSLDRKASFLKRYYDSNGPLPLHRFPGIVVTDPKIQSPGDHGCTMSHAAVLQRIAKMSEGWYLVCEDDGYGDFGGIARHPLVRAIVATTDKRYINLSTQWWAGRNLHREYSLSDVHIRTTAYLVHSSICLETAHTLHQNKFQNVDLTLKKTLCEPRLLKNYGNSKGAYVGLIDPPADEHDSERTKINLG